MLSQRSQVLSDITMRKMIISYILSPKAISSVGILSRLNKEWHMALLPYKNALNCFIQLLDELKIPLAMQKECLRNDFQFTHAMAIIIYSQLNLIKSTISVFDQQYILEKTLREIYQQETNASDIAITIDSERLDGMTLRDKAINALVSIYFDAIPGLTNNIYDASGQISLWKNPFQIEHNRKSFKMLLMQQLLELVFVSNTKPQFNIQDDTDVVSGLKNELKTVAKDEAHAYTKKLRCAKIGAGSSLLVMIGGFVCTGLVLTKNIDLASPAQGDALVGLDFASAAVLLGFLIYLRYQMTQVNMIKNDLRSHLRFLDKNTNAMLREPLLKRAEESSNTDEVTPSIFRNN